MITQKMADHERFDNDVVFMRGGRLPNKGRYGCAASAKPGRGKISQKDLMPRQKHYNSVWRIFGN